MQSQATTVTEYLKSLPADRRKALNAVRKVIKANMGAGYKEGMQYGMIGYFVPHKLYPDGYHCDPKQPLPFAGLASQKNHMSVYLMGLYGDPKEAARFEKAWKATGKRLDMGKCCVRFRKLEDVPLEVIGEAVARMPAERYIEVYEKGVRGARSGARGKKVTGGGSRVAGGKKKATSKKKTGKKK